MSWFLKLAMVSSIICFCMSHCDLLPFVNALFDYRFCLSTGFLTTTNCLLTQNGISQQSWECHLNHSDQLKPQSWLKNQQKTIPPTHRSTRISPNKNDSANSELAYYCGNQWNHLRRKKQCRIQVNGVCQHQLFESILQNRLKHGSLSTSFCGRNSQINVSWIIKLMIPEATM